MLVEFVNAMFTLQSKKEYVLYQGAIAGGGFTRVSITKASSEGYNQSYYKIKQVIAEEGNQAHIQQVDIPNLETVYKIIQMALEEREYGLQEDNRRISEGDDNTIAEDLESDTIGNNDSFIPIVKTQSRHVNKVLSKTREIEQRIEPEQLYRQDNAPIAQLQSQSQPVQQNVDVQQIQQVRARTVQPRPQQFEIPSGLQDNAGYDELDMFMGGGIKFANLKQSPTNVKASAEHRSNMESILGGEL